MPISTEVMRKEPRNVDVHFFPIGSLVRDKETGETGIALSIWNRSGNDALSNTMLLVQYDEAFVDPTDQSRRAYVPVECLELLVESAEFIRI